VDQASALREMRKGIDMTGKTGGGVPKNVRVIAITSGKGGVGKTNIAANLGYCLATMKKNVMVLDADMGLANLDLILGLTPTYNLCHVLHGEKTLKETIVGGPGGMMILPASSGIQELSEMSVSQKAHLLDEMSTIDDFMDFVLIDTGAGISSNVMYFNAAAREIIVIVTPEPTSMTDAYALMKILYQRHSRKRFRLIVNMVKDETEAKAVYQRLSTAMGHFLNLGVEYLGFIPSDSKLSDAVRIQKPITAAWPSSPAARSLRQIAKQICSEESDQEGIGGLRFFWESVGSS
jgi:flagellar biosynthesis protein FlhG